MKHIFLMSLAIPLILWGMPGCSSADEETTSTGTADGMATGTGYIIGPEGGELAGPGGISLVIPANALAEEVEISINTASLKFPVGIEPSSAMFQLEPSGLTFASPVTVSFPSDDSTVDVFWTDLGTETFHRLPSVWEDGRVSVQAEHFSFTFTGLVRSRGHCEEVVPQNECQVGANDGQPNATCDVTPAEGPVIPGFCFNYHDGLGNVIGAVCKETGCQSSETQAWMCLNLIDDNCNSLVDTSDTGCTECMTDINCGGGSVCIHGFCESCSSRPVDCTSNHGQPDDSACEYMVNETIPTQGLCMHSTDMNGDSCGTSCRYDTACAAEENCGNQMDDDCNGIVDDGCPALCSSDAGCAVGEICDVGYCKACPGADLPMECSNGSQHGMPDPNCMYPDPNFEGQTVPGALCLHITNAAGTACGSKCTQSTTCGTDEICGNHIDDNCDGVVDEGCVSCNTNSDCQAGERCKI